MVSVTQHSLAMPLLSPAPDLLNHILGGLGYLRLQALRDVPVLAQVGDHCLTSLQLLET